MENQWNRFDEQKPPFGDFVVCVSEAYMTTDGELTRNVEVGCYMQNEWDLNPDTNEYELVDFPHFEEVGTGFYLCDPEFWMALPPIPAELMKHPGDEAS